MANFLHDNKDILFHLEHMDLDRIIALREDDFAEKELYPHAPVDVADAKDSYMKILGLVGEISGDELAPRAAGIDEEGVTLENGEVRYAKGTEEVLELFSKAELMGFCFPRKYGGLNCPTTILSIAAEITSRADGSFLNFGLQQDIGETLNKFGSEEQKMKVLPILASGKEGCSMILTEPDAGSDLQAVMLKATQDPSGNWKLNGVKRFITNGCGKYGLVLARSEEASKGAGGLSFFLYERDKHMVIRRLENKLGIHGSPTCELQFNDAPATLVGERRRGLIKYTMWLMNSARLGIAAQALGIAESAYREAYKYASERIQFNVKVKSLPPVYEMLTEMRVAIEAGRTLLYETARFVDLKEGLEHASEIHPEKSAELKSELKKYSRLASLFTPIVKAYNTEMSNKVCYDAIQIHGGPGYMKEFPVERHYRDARITNIYEGTTQLQVVAAIGGITSGAAVAVFDDYEGEDYAHAPELFQQTKKARNMVEKALVHLKGLEDEEAVTYHSRRLVEMTTDIVQSYLLLRDARHDERKMKLAEIFIKKAAVRVEMNMNFIVNGEQVLVRNYKAVIDA
ncbi:MAG: acyl-CoA dehydrogenase [Treponema sp. GWB1_62_6]|nr:MAG: acyl-CoA dehydrogenase [Treponema sp. GWA1_62_8]OHE62357.1 MAG: acyl-CoA dehydrogenase [Treponema sp. GWB1_62_6]OHE65562.1 MAG: acyl-CoA dehydrogenase [Treponema sp. GWC1_61_84]OHE72703.1 MAG: acyl-CoA dehydrogenase [Treponema sp. RIFOXYC1_FULL_61_9]HCM27767.1 acyl-CoA dehydrogenase [Treponema sp.]